MTIADPVAEDKDEVVSSAAANGMAARHSGEVAAFVAKRGRFALDTAHSTASGRSCNDRHNSWGTGNGKDGGITNGNGRSSRR